MDGRRRAFPSGFSGLSSVAPTAQAPILAAVIDPESGVSCLDVPPIYRDMESIPVQERPSNRMGLPRFRANLIAPNNEPDLCLRGDGDDPKGPSTKANMGDSEGCPTDMD